MICTIPHGSYPTTYEEKRSCTDCFFSVIFLVYWVGLFILAGFGLSYGNAFAFWHGTDYLGYQCGVGDDPVGLESYVQSSVYQSKVWSENKFLWKPLVITPHEARKKKPVDESAFSLELFDSGICVQRCPTLDSSSNQTNARVFTYGHRSVNGTSLKYFRQKSFAVTYESIELYGRCIPTSLPNPSGKKMPKTYMQKFIEQCFTGILEVTKCYRLVLISIAVSALLSMLYIHFLRCFTKVMAYASVAVMISAALAMGYVLYKWSDGSADVGDDSSDFYRATYFALAIVSWICALVGSILFYWFQKNIDEATTLIQVAGALVSSHYQLIIVPIVALVAFFMVLVLFITLVVLMVSVEETFLEEWASSYMELIASATGSGDFGPQMMRLNVLHWVLMYIAFGFVWTVEVLIAYSFMVLSFCCVYWYYSTRCNPRSKLEVKDKYMPRGSLHRSFSWSVFYHLGSIALGSFLVAILQIIQVAVRVINYQATRILQKNDVNRFLFYVSDFLVTICKKILDVATKNSYVFICITSRCFCLASKESFKLLNGRFITFVFLQMIKELLFLIGKVLVVTLTLFFSMSMLDSPNIVPLEVQHFYPLLAIAISSFIIASIFFHLLSVSAQALLLCFIYDAHHNNGLYAPKELEKFVR